MKFSYYKDTDSLYISLTEHSSIRSEEVLEGVVLDFDDNGNLIGIDIDCASRKVDLSKIELISPPTVPQVLVSDREEMT